MLAAIACSLLLTLKAAFLVAGAFNLSVAYNQRFFYPLSVLPEFLVVIILIFPGFLATLVGKAGKSQLQDEFGPQQHAHDNPQFVTKQDGATNCVPPGSNGNHV